jgi:hypothetical protein
MINRCVNFDLIDLDNKKTKINPKSKIRNLK